jgi:hypothetical protein
MIKDAGGRLYGPVDSSAADRRHDSESWWAASGDRVAASAACQIEARCTTRPKL